MLQTCRILPIVVLLSLGAGLTPAHALPPALTLQPKPVPQTIQLTQKELGTADREFAEQQWRKMKKTRLSAFGTPLYIEDGGTSQVATWRSETSELASLMVIPDQESHSCELWLRSQDFQKIATFSMEGADGAYCAADARLTASGAIIVAIMTNWGEELDGNPVMQYFRIGSPDGEMEVVDRLGPTARYPGESSWVSEPASDKAISHAMEDCRGTAADDIESVEVVIDVCRRLRTMHAPTTLVQAASEIWQTKLTQKRNAQSAHHRAKMRTKRRDIAPPPPDKAFYWCYTDVGWLPAAVPDGRRCLGQLPYPVTPEVRRKMHARLIQHGHIECTEMHVGTVCRLASEARR